MFPKASAESPPMFESGLVDKFSRTHWSIVPILYGPATMALLWYGIARAGVSVLWSFGLMALGVLAWTFSEYWLHRLFFHWQPGGRWGERMHFVVHGVHHKWPRDRFRLVMPPAVSITLFWLFLGLFWVTMGRYAWPFHAGYVAGYMLYDISHYYIHHGHPKSRRWKDLRTHHLTHHSPRQGNECKFGVSTSLWDRVFGTYS